MDTVSAQDGHILDRGMESIAMNIDCYRNSTEFENLRGEWTDLLNRSSRPSAFMSWEWMYSWWETFGATGISLIIIGVRDRAGKLIALAPLIKEQVRWRGLVPLNRIRFLGTGENEEDEVCSEYLDIIVESDQERAAIVRRVIAWLQEHEKWDEIVLDPVAKDSSVFDGLPQAMQQGIHVREMAPAYFLPLPGNWEEFLNSLSSNQRSRIRKSIRELEKIGDVQLDVADLQQEPGPMFDELVVLHQRRWTEVGKPGVFASTKFLAFHRALISRLREGDGVFLAALKLDQKVIGCVYCLVQNTKVYFYQSGVDTEISSGNSRIKPGLALHAMAIRYFIGNGMTEYDFLAGDNNNYKAQWTKHRRANFRFVITRKASKMVFISLAERIARVARKGLLRG